MAQSRLSAGANVLPRCPNRTSTKHTAGTPLNLGRPGGFDFGRILAAVVKTGEKFGRHIGALVDRQGQGFPQEFLGPKGHGAILDPNTQPNKRLQPTAAGAILSRRG